MGSMMSWPVTRRSAIALSAILATSGGTLLAGCSPKGTAPKGNDANDADGAPRNGDVPAQGTPADPMTTRIDSTLSALTLEQKINQLFFLEPESIFPASPVVSAGDASRRALTEHPVGGICYFGQNLRGPDQTRTMLSSIRQYSQDAVGLPPFISVDEEGGTVSRIGGKGSFNIPNVGDMRDVGASGDTQRAFEVSQTMAKYLVELGFNLDFAPVADVVNGSSQTMARRSFGTDAQAVAQMVEAAVRGFTEGGILCCAKHFPGIGSAEGDPEVEPISTQKTMEQLQAEELLPFRNAIAAGVPFVMVGHLACPKLTGDDTPASLSRAIQTDILRVQLGFEGIIITDSLKMGAIGDRYNATELGVKALEAGADMLLMTPDFSASYEGVLSAVRDGTLSEERIDDSLRRIIKAKLRLMDASA